MKILTFSTIIIFVISCFPSACSHNMEKNSIKKKQSSIKMVKDSILILSIKEIDDRNQVATYNYYLDTINNHLSVIFNHNLINSQYKSYNITSHSIEDINKSEGNLRFQIKNGLIVKKTLDDKDDGISFEYDQARRLRKIHFDGGKIEFIWKRDTILQVNICPIAYSDSTSQRFNQLIKIKHSNTTFTKHYSSELLNNLLGNGMGDYLFVHLGLYGRLPVGNDYTKEIISYDYKGLHRQEHCSIKEFYSDDSILLISEKHESNKKIYKYKYSWSLPNISVLYDHLISYPLNIP